MTPTNLAATRQVLIARWIVRIDPVTKKRTLISKWEVARCAAPTARRRRVKCITCATTVVGPTGPRSCRSVTGAIQRSTPLWGGRTIRTNYSVWSERVSNGHETHTVRWNFRLTLESLAVQEIKGRFFEGHRLWSIREIQKKVEPFGSI
jgi:hypothetical protein